MDELPQEIIDHIVSFVPRRVGKPAANRHGRDRRTPLLPALATLSRKFQKAVEKHTFKWLWIEANNSELDEFERIVRAERWANVRCFNAQLVLVVPPLPLNITLRCGSPDPSGSESDDDNKIHLGFEYERAHVREADREASTALLRRLWERIATLSHQLGHDEANLKLELFNDYTIRPLRHAAFEDRKKDYGFSLQDLTDDVKDFPILHQVREFEFVNISRYWNPRVGAILASKMPNLESTSWQIDECPSLWGRYYSLDKKYRDGLVEGAAAAGTLPHTLRKFRCRLKHPFYDHPQPLPRFINDGSAPDPVSCALQRLTRDCEEIKLKGSFMPCLFDPPPSPPSTETAVGEQPKEQELCWQRTRILHVMMDLSRPDGTWHFSPGENEIDVPDTLLNCRQLPPGYRTSPVTYTIGAHKYEVDVEKNDYDYLIKNMHMVAPRRFPPYPIILPASVVDNDENGKLNALLTAFSRCCARMPALEVAFLEISAAEFPLRQPGFAPDGGYESDNDWWDDFIDDHAFEVMCVPAGHHAYGWPADEAADSSRTRVYLHGRGWQPHRHRQAMKELEKIGLKRDGFPAIVQVVEWGRCIHFEGSDPIDTMLLPY